MKRCCNQNCKQGDTCPARKGSNMKHYTGRFPRSLKQAFGPYAELHVDRRHWLDRNAGKVFMALGAALSAVSLLALSGCATITQGTEQTITVHTDRPCTATRGDQSATITPEWTTLKVSKSRSDIMLECGDHTQAIESKVSAAGVTSILWVDLGIVDTITGAMWEYPSEVKVNP